MPDQTSTYAGAGLLLVLALGCATPGPDSLDETEQLRRGARFRVESVEAGTAQAEAIDGPKRLRDAMDAALAQAGVLATGTAGEDHYDLRLGVTEYEPGNAFKRWLLPGYGATVLRIHGEVVDPRDGKIVATLDHRRSIVAGGLYTVGGWETIFDTVARDIARELAGQSQGSGFFVDLAPWASHDVDVPVTAQPRRIALAAFRDRRAERGRIGERTAAFGVSMGDVDLSRDVADFLHEAVRDDLRAAGHTLVAPGEPAERVVEGTVRRFHVRTDTTPLYWDVVATIELELTARAPTAAEPSRSALAACEARERTYAWPGRAIVAKALDACLARLMEDVRREAVWTAPEAWRSAPTRARARRAARDTAVLM